VWSRGSDSLRRHGRRNLSSGRSSPTNEPGETNDAGTTRAGTGSPVRSATSASCSAHVAVERVSFDMHQGQILGLIVRTAPADHPLQTASPGSISRARAHPAGSRSLPDGRPPHRIAGSASAAPSRTSRCFQPLGARHVRVGLTRGTSTTSS